AVRNLDAGEMEFTVCWTLLPPEHPDEAEPPPGVPPVARWRRSMTVEGRRTEVLETSLSVDRPELWWPWTLGAQPLYGLVVQVDGEARCTTCLSQVGIREVGLEPTPSGLAWTVNGRRHFPRGAVLPALLPGDDCGPVKAR